MSNCCDIVIEVPEEVIVIEMTPEGADGKSLNPRGTWDGSAVYARLDLVDYQGNSYIALKSVPAGTLPTDTEYWMVNASSGDQIHWGNISGTLSDQTDLAEALSEKADTDSVYTKSETNDLLSAKADSDDVYTKSEANDLLSAKADTADLGDLASKDKVDYDTDIDNLPELGDLASKDTVDYETDIDNLPELGDLASKDKVDYETDIDNLPTLGDLAAKNKVDWDTDIDDIPQTFPPADHNHDGRYYTKSQVDTALSSKANSADVYTKQQADTLLDKKLDTDSDTTITGSILTFDSAVENGIKDLTVEINPVQDLHGLPNPYPAGGGKNLFDPTSLVGSNATVAVNNNKFTLTGLNAIYPHAQFNLIDFAGKGTFYISCTGKRDSAEYTNTTAVQLFYNDGTNHYSGKAYFNDSNEFTIQDVAIEIPANATTAYLQFYVQNINSSVAIDKTATFTDVRISATQNTSWTPYSNICPISGHTSATVTRTGKNLIDDNSETTITFTLPQGTYYAKRFPITTDRQINSKFEALIGNTWTTINSDTYDNGQFVVTGGLGWGESPEQTIVLSKSYEFRMSIYTLNGFRGKAHVMLTTGAMPSDYEPYQGTSVTIDLDGTRYGGTLNVLTGEMTVDRKFIEYDGSNDEDWKLVVSNSRAYIAVDDIDTSVSDHDTGNIISNLYQKHSYFYLNDVRNCITMRYNIAQINVFDYDLITSNFTIEGWRTFLSNNHLQLVYPLATPQTIQLTPAEVSTLIGQNVLWCDTGDSTAIIRTGAGKMAYQDSIDYSELTGKPTLGNLADHDTVNYETEVTNKPTLGTMSAESADDYYDKDEVEDLINASGVTAELDASGSIATFETRLAENLSKLSVQIEPVQDLHGYDAPWSAGGGKNLFDYESPNSSGNGLTISLSDVGIFTISGIPTSNYVQIVSSKEIIDLLEDGASYTISATSYNTNFFLQVVATKSDNSKSYYDTKSNKSTFTVNKGTYNSYKINITTNTMENWGESSKTLSAGFMLEQGSIATSFAPYSNICPISGHSSAVVTRTGRNILDVSDATASVSTLTYTLTDDGGIHVSGTNSAGVYNIIDSNMPFKQLTEYTVSGTTATSRLRLRLYNSNNTVLRELYFGDGGGTFTPTVEEVKCDVTLISSASTWNDTFYFMIRLSSNTDSTFAKYTGTSVTISLGDTRYGGVLDVLNGKLTVDRAIHIFDGTETIGAYASGADRLPLYEPSPLALSNGSLLSNMLREASGYSDITENAGTAFLRQNGIAMHINSALKGTGWVQSDVQSYLTALNTIGTPLTVVYDLNTPVVVSLTPAQVQALAGKNFVWASTGDVALSYYDSNTEEAINDTKQMIADMTDQMVAPKNLTVNNFIVVNKHLYKVTANVASGSALVIGTNVVETTVAEQLTYLLSQL